jgi:alkaline phosphatase D
VPWFVTWDDHEVENDYAATQPQDPADEASFAARRPDRVPGMVGAPARSRSRLRDPAPTTPIHRAAVWGDLLGLSILDTRQYRSDQACGNAKLRLEPPCPETFEPGRTMIGEAQEAWLFEQLSTQQTVWRTIAQQVVFGDTTWNTAILNYDQWDGYPEQRNRIVERLGQDQVPNVIVLTGDIHFAGTGTIRTAERTAGAPVGVEFVATSISSGGAVNPALTEVIKTFPFILDVELVHRGYILHTVTPQRWSAEYRMMESVEDTGVRCLRPRDLRRRRRHQHVHFARRTADGPVAARDSGDATPRRGTSAVGAVPLVIAVVELSDAASSEVSSA